MPPSHIIRTRWAAVGAAVAVAVGAGGVGLIEATSPDGASAYVPIVPCRLADTRPDSTVGPRATPLGADDTATYDGWGDVPGDCNLPDGTTGLQLNVTAVDATTLTNLRLYPTGEPTPTASNLNPAPGEPPTPNAVTVTLNTTTGQFDVFNRFGQVHIVIDALGYYTDHDHDDRYYTEAEIDDLLAEPPVTLVEPHFLDATTLGDQPWFLNSNRHWEHVQNAANTGCLLFPIEVPADTRLNTVRLAYSANSDLLVQTRIVSLRRAGGVGGPPTEIINMINTSETIDGGLGSGSVTIEHDMNELPPGANEGPIPGPGYDTYFSLCTTHTVTLLSVTLSYV
jgi:hypothetical protein